MLVAVLGGLLGILMMIPLRRALIVQQHGILKYPEGTACAEVLRPARRRGPRIASPSAARDSGRGGAETQEEVAAGRGRSSPGFGVGVALQAR